MSEFGRRRFLEGLGLGAAAGIGLDRNVARTPDVVVNEAQRAQFGEMTGVIKRHTHLEKFWPGGFNFDAETTGPFSIAVADMDRTKITHFQLSLKVDEDDPRNLFYPAIEIIKKENPDTNAKSFDIRAHFLPLLVATDEVAELGESLPGKTVEVPEDPLAKKNRLAFINKNPNDIPPYIPLTEEEMYYYAAEIIGEPSMREPSKNWVPCDDWSRGMTDIVPGWAYNDGKKGEDYSSRDVTIDSSGEFTCYIIV